MSWNRSESPYQRSSRALELSEESSFDADNGHMAALRDTRPTSKIITTRNVMTTGGAAAMRDMSVVNKEYYNA